MPTPPGPANACVNVTACSPANRCRNSANTSSRPANGAGRPGASNTPGVTGQRARPPGNRTCPAGRLGPSNAATTRTRASASSTPKMSVCTIGASSAGGAASSTRTDTNDPGSRANAAVHSAVAITDAQYRALVIITSRCASDSAALISDTKFDPAPKSHRWNRTENPACSATPATHSAHATSAPVKLTNTSTGLLLTSQGYPAQVQ